MKSAYDKIAAGLEDTIAYAEGDKRRAREATVDVKAIRQASGMTQAAFAEAFGLRVAALRDWEMPRPEKTSPILPTAITSTPASRQASRTVGAGGSRL